VIRRTSLHVRRSSERAFKDSKLKLHAPEGWIRLNQLQADVPSLMVSPNYMRLGGSSASWID
jgi:hypothetical protein